MIRLPLSTIELSRREISDYERRRKKSKETNTGLAKSTIGFLPLGSTRKKLLRSEELYRDSFEAIEKQFAGHRYLADKQHSTPSLSPPLSYDAIKQNQESPSHEILGLKTRSSSSNESEDHEYVQVSPEGSPENMTLEPYQHRPTSPSKDDFHYGGFLESPMQPTLEDRNQSSSPFLPDDVSTPPSLHLPSLRIGHRSLPRSPLFISQNASSSPERRPGFALTPRVTSRVATHNTPGIIFAQPPRRPPRRSPRHHRHQTNSFSFDSSEKSSAAYEQQRVSSTSTNGSIPRPSDNIVLHDELHGSSWQSSRNPSGISDVSRAQNTGGEDSNDDAAKDNVDKSKEFIFSSPQLPLPHPFLSTSRSPSPELSQSPAASPVRSDSLTPANIFRGRALSRGSSPAMEQRSELNSSPPPRTAFSPMSLLRQAASQAQRVISAHRARSPFHRQGLPVRHPATESTSTSSTPRQSQSSQRMELEPSTPAHIYDIYVDDLSPATQPQTPAHLPEFRHRSTYHPSYTAPVTRAAARRNRDEDHSRVIMARESPAAHHRRGTRRTPVTPQSSRARRAVSPVGMVQDGFRGLYGGRENGDEEQNWVEGVRFNNAEVRLWGARDANLRVTPEPEDWRVGRRN